MKQLSSEEIYGIAIEREDLFFFDPLIATANERQALRKVTVDVLEKLEDKVISDIPNDFHELAYDICVSSPTMANHVECFLNLKDNHLLKLKVKSYIVYRAEHDKTFDIMNCNNDLPHMVDDMRRVLGSSNPLYSGYSSKGEIASRLQQILQTTTVPSVPGYAQLNLVLENVKMSSYSPRMTTLNFFEQFEIASFFNLFGISFNKISLFLLFALAIFGFFYAITKIQWNIFPNNWQSVIELVYEFIYGLVQNQIGKQGAVYFVLIADIFLFIVGLNMLGMFPFGFTVSSHIATTGGLALAIFIGIQIIGATISGWKFLAIFIPGGVPMWLVPIIPLIEFVSYSFRVVSLAVRLIANMISGHLLIHIFAGFAWKMLTHGGLLYLLFPIIFGIVFFLTGMEMGISILQGYVFTILTCIYLVDVMHSHH